jgi:probable blue pigment (indigoidine) exporter
MGLILLAFCRRLPRGIWWWRVVVLGLLNFGFWFPLLYIAAYRLPGGISATVAAGLPLITILLSWALLKEHPTAARIVLGVAAIVGVGLLVLTSKAHLDPIGLLAAITGITSMGFATVLIKRWGRPVSLLPFLSWQLVVGGLFLLPITLLLEGFPPSVNWINIAGFSYLGFIGTGIAYALWYRGIERLPVTAVTFLNLLSPITATLLGWIFLGQSLTLLQLFGAGIVLVSVLLGQLVTAPQRSASGAKTEPSRPVASGNSSAHV